jgi:uncharacterized membrane protein
MGEKLATHWNAAGEVDGYGSTFMGLYFLPILTMGISLLLVFLPGIDPMKANIETFRSDYNRFILVFAGFMYYIYSLSLAWNLGWHFSMNAAIAPAFGLFFVLTGMMVRKAKRNFFIGIRTPWTLANDVVWDKTHQLGGKLFIGAGLLTAATVFYPSISMTVLMVTVIGAAVISLVYSYVEFKRIENQSSTN